ncbi:MAG: glycosyltransferase, partial [Oxalobacteraceae bacterium]
GEPGFQIVLVPPSLPRTKPKALNVALPLATGEFLVLYDAEDRPDPEQLHAAFQAFRHGGPRLACVQAPLVIGNGTCSWLSGHFAMEYAALFRGFLPWLAREGLPLPLGGTSNHFRREALVAVGAWDSHNVTEDADLGIRLARRGLMVGTIDVPTGEDAPERWNIWLRQRTRWMKGWMQTWLVHMRQPIRLWRELGPRGFLAFQVLFFGMVGSGLAHPLSLVFILYSLSSAAGSTPLLKALVVADCVILVLGYLAYGVLLLKSLAPEERTLFRPLFVSVYFYWMLVSLAVLRAMVQLVAAPHRWEKTPHGTAAKAKAGSSAPKLAAPAAD